MVRSWDEVSVNQNYVSLLEVLVRNQSEEEAIACRKCGDIFFGYTSLTRHCQSDHSEDGTLEEVLHSGNFLPPQNFFSSFSQVTSENRESVLQYGSPRPTNLSSAANHQVPMLSQNSMQLRRHISARSQPYPSLTSYRSALKHGTFFLNRTQSTNLGSGVGSQPTGLANLRAPDNLIRPGVFTSRSVQLNAHSSRRPSGSASPPIRQSTFRLLPCVAPGTTNLVRGRGRAIRSFTRPVSRAAARYPSNGYAGPFIQQQERPTQETRVIEGQNDDSNNTVDQLDLTLRL